MIKHYIPVGSQVHHEIGDGQIHPMEGQILMQNTGQVRLSTAYLLVHQEIGDGQIHTVTQTI